MTSIGHTFHGHFHDGSELGRMQSKSCTDSAGDSKSLLEKGIITEKEPRHREIQEPFPDGLWNHACSQMGFWVDESHKAIHSLLWSSQFKLGVLLL